MKKSVQNQLPLTVLYQVEEFEEIVFLMGLLWKHLDHLNRAKLFSYLKSLERSDGIEVKICFTSKK